MVIWKGAGILVLVIALPLAGLGGVSLGSALGSDTASGIGAAGGLALAAVAVYFLGQRLNAPTPGYHLRTGAPVNFRNGHTLFFVPMQYWGFVLLGISVLVLGASLLSA
ncbi:hypothetical protein FHX37_3121 [Haloactinospora alba]|uniref:Uncharacterized protein n=2 Tax=Haloactinospora alba TaxID=405555 RepID=A0A543NMS1_9ACTN|nr:hypothetical protein FHX37_3121 [Haloactinospora alba]